MNVLAILIFSLNIIFIFGQNAVSEDCMNVNKFFNDYMSNNNRQLNIPECCNPQGTSHYIKCENGHISEM